ncbi:MAG TPA: isoprenyl transferase [Blastocatellia bacterium]|nr:isoprenyl transferase [Blastocatellia bacterium]
MAMRSIDIASTGRWTGEDLLLQLDLGRLPRHVAIIMDGNGRWAARRRLPRIVGHRAGADAVRRTVETAARLGLECLTLYAFSTENWKRPKYEVRALMDLLVEYVRKELHSLKENNIQFRMLGRTDDLYLSVLEQIRKAELATFQNTGLRLSIALNYGSRAEIVDAVKRVACDVAAGRIDPEEINEEIVHRNLYTRALPDPDLLIRTSGEMRISNFLLWQIAYAEIHVTDTLWPDFDERDLFAALLDYQSRDRRYGRIVELEEVPAQRKERACIPRLILPT